LIAFAGAAFLLVGAVGTRAAQPRECSSFKSQAAAQQYFVEAGGSPKRPVGSLDPNHNGVACELLTRPFAGYATLAFNKVQRFLYGTVTLPGEGEHPEYPCLFGNKHFPDAPRILNVYKVGPDGSGKPIFSQYGIGTEARPASGRLVWRVGRKRLGAGYYYVEIEEQIRSSPYERTQCPAFRSAAVPLP
jgi:hypothetical protein